MAQGARIIELTAPLRMNVRRTKLTEEQFMALCQENSELRLELTAQGEFVVMPPTGSEGGWRSGRVFFFLTLWTDQDRTGLSFDSSTGFTLPNGAIRSPDASWIRRERWEALTKVQRMKFAPSYPMEILDNPQSLSGDPILPGFRLNVQELW